MGVGVPTWGSVYWPWFLITTSVAFLIPETVALVTNTANTLSDYSWRQLHVHAGVAFSAHTAAWALSLGMWLVAVAWLTGHIWFAAFR